MKGIGKMICFQAGLATLLLSYVHLQAGLFETSYAIDANNKIHSEKVEEYRFLKYQVDQMKAPVVLEKKLGELQLDLHRPNEINVVRYVTPQPQTNLAVDLPELQGWGLFTNRVGEFFGRWVQVAQATME